MNVNDAGKKQSRRRSIFVTVAGTAIIIALILLPLILISSYALTGIGDIFDSPLCDPSDPGGIQSVARIELPPSYTNLWSTCGGLQGWWAIATFEMNPGELNMFLETTSIESTTLSPTMPVQRLSEYRQEIGDLETYLYGTHDSFDWFEEIIINTSDPNRWAVYFRVLAG